MESVLLSELKVGSKAPGKIFLDDGFLLLDTSCPFTSEIQKALFEWNIKTVFCEAKIEAPQPEIKEAVKEEPPKPIRKMEVDEFEDVSFDDFGVSFSQSSKPEQKPSQSAPQSQSQPQSHEAKPATQPSEKKFTEEESAKLQECQTIYNSYLNYTMKVYTRYATHKELDLSSLSREMKEFCLFIESHKKYVLRLTPEISIVGKDFLISHSLRSAVFSIVIGQQLNLQFGQVVELGVTALLHEIGQIRLPPQLYLSPKPLSPNERAQLATHTVLGYNILKEKGFPQNMQLAVLEHHERENGSGYPRHLSAQQISLYAKIISVACSYEAITSPRHYKTSKNPFEAMVEMLQNKQKQYDETIIKALLYSVSLYPIGAYVLLSNGRIAQVTDTNKNDPRNPVVEIIGMKNAAGNPLQVQIDGIKLHIAKVLDKQELAKYNIQK